MEEIIDEFYEKVIKNHEDILSHEVRRGRIKYFGYIFGIGFAIFLVSFAGIMLYPTPVGFIIIPIIIGIGTIALINIIYGIIRVYFKTSDKFSVKERILYRLNLKENGSIDKRNTIAPVFILFFSLFLFIFLYIFSISSEYPEIAVVSTIIGHSFVIFITYRAFLIKKTKITKEYIVIKKPLSFSKIPIKWTAINTAATTYSYHHNRDGPSYSIHHLILNTSLQEKSIDLYLGRNRNATILKILDEFFRYMSGKPSAYQSEEMYVSPQTSSYNTAIYCPECGEKQEESLEICPYCGKAF